MIKEILVREFLDPLFSSIFDPQPITFKAGDEAGVAPVRAACQKPVGAIYRLRTSLNRNAFLSGCLDYTEQEMIEHIIVGLGHKHGRTTKIEAVGHVVGATDKVSFPVSLHQAVRQHIASDHKAEALVFHNHPKNPMNVLIDNTPLASSTDRHTLLRYYVQPLIAIKTFMDGAECGAISVKMVSPANFARRMCWRSSTVCKS